MKMTRYLLLFFIFFNIVLNSETCTAKKFFVRISDRVGAYKKQKIEIAPLYATEKSAKRYVEFLLNEKKLDIDFTKKYSIGLEEQGENWFVMLFLEDKQCDDDIIVDSFDMPLLYVFYLDKESGCVSNLYKMQQN